MGKLQNFAEFHVERKAIYFAAAYRVREIAEYVGP